MTVRNAFYGQHSTRAKRVLKSIFTLKIFVSLETSKKMCFRLKQNETISLIFQHLAILTAEKIQRQYRNRETFLVGNLSHQSVWSVLNLIITALCSLTASSWSKKRSFWAIMGNYVCLLLLARQGLGLQVHFLLRYAGLVQHRWRV